IKSASEISSDVSCKDGSSTADSSPSWPSLSTDTSDPSSPGSSEPSSPDSSEPSSPDSSGPSSSDSSEPSLPSSSELSSPGSSPSSVSLTLKAVVTPVFSGPSAVMEYSPFSISSGISTSTSKLPSSSA